MTGFGTRFGTLSGTPFGTTFFDFFFGFGDTFFDFFFGSCDAFWDTFWDTFFWDFCHILGRFNFFPVQEKVGWGFNFFNAPKPPNVPGSGHTIFYK